MSEAAKAEIVHQPNPYDEQAEVTPMALIQMAVSQNADVEKLAKLMELALRWDAEQAKKAYVKAINAFKSDPPEIIKNHNVAYTTKTGANIAYAHATLDCVCDAVIERLSKYGISHRWKARQPNGKIEITCVLTHEQGHSEDTTLEGSPDDSGGKNAIQAISSTVTYLERYTLLAACGLAAVGTDNDGQGAPTWDKLQEYLDSISTCPNLNVLQATFKAGFLEAVKIQNTQAMKMLTEAKDARKAILLKDEPAQ